MKKLVILAFVLSSIQAFAQDKKLSTSTTYWLHSLTHGKTKISLDVIPLNAFDLSSSDRRLVNDNGSCIQEGIIEDVELYFNWDAALTITVGTKRMMLHTVDGLNITLKEVDQKCVLVKAETRFQGGEGLDRISLNAGKLNFELPLTSKDRGYLVLRRNGGFTELGKIYQK